MFRKLTRNPIVRELFANDFSLRGLGWAIIGVLGINAFWWLLVLCVLTRDA